jgi:hypothetical protein
MDFDAGDRVVHTETGVTATVSHSEGGRSHVFWDDDQPPTMVRSRYPDFEPKYDPRLFRR